MSNPNGAANSRRIDLGERTGLRTAGQNLKLVSRLRNEAVDQAQFQGPSQAGVASNNELIVLGVGVVTAKLNLQDTTDPLLVVLTRAE